MITYDSNVDDYDDDDDEYRDICDNYDRCQMIDDR